MALLTWTDVARLALSTGIVTAVINQGAAWTRDWLKERSTSKRDARYIALRVAIVLETFALECAHVISDHNMHETSGGHAGQRHAGLPELQSYPSDLEWKALQQNLAARALSLPIEVKSAERSVAFMWDVTADQDSAMDSCSEGAARCGLLAWKLAADLRQSYGYPPLVLQRDGWDPVKLLRETDDTFTDQRELRLRA